jgi:hypothetical protein
MGYESAIWNMENYTLEDLVTEAFGCLALN